MPEMLLTQLSPGEYSMPGEQRRHPTTALPHELSDLTNILGKAGLDGGSRTA